MESGSFTLALVHFYLRVVLKGNSADQMSIYRKVEILKNYVLKFDIIEENSVMHHMSKNCFDFYFIQVIINMQNTT